MVKKPQKSGKKAPAGNKRPRRATKTLKIQKSLEKNKKNKYIGKKISIEKKPKKAQKNK